MKFPLLAILVLMMTTPAAVQSAQKDFDLPALHKIHEVTLSPSYSCRSAEDPKEDYGNTALFLTSSLKESNSPALFSTEHVTAGTMWKPAGVARK